MATYQSRASRETNLVATYSGTIRVILLEELAEASRTHTFANTAINTSTNVITITPGASPPVVGSRGLITTTGTLAAGLSSTTPYYVISKSTNDITISTVPGGTAFDFTNQGTGTYSFIELPLVPASPNTGHQIYTMADLVRRELTTYPDDGVAEARPAVTLGSVTYPGNGLFPQYAGASIEFDNSGGSGDIDFQFFALLKGGSATPGDTTGELLPITALDIMQTVGAGNIITTSITLSTKTTADT